MMENKIGVRDIIMRIFIFIMILLVLCICCSLGYPKGTPQPIIDRRECEKKGGRYISVSRGDDQCFVDGLLVDVYDHKRI